MGIKVPYSTDFKDLQKVYDSLIGTVKATEDFSGENKALAFKIERSSEVYIVLPCGRRPSIRCSNDCFEWNNFRLIKKVDCEDL